MKKKIDRHHEFLDHVNKILCQGEYHEEGITEPNIVDLDSDGLDEICVQAMEQYNNSDITGFIASIKILSQYFETYHDVILAEYFCSSLLSIRLADMLDQKFPDKHMLPVVFELITNISFQTSYLCNLMTKESIKENLHILSIEENDIIFTRIVITMLYNLLIDIPLNFANFKTDISKILDIAGKNKNHQIRCMYSFLLINIFRRNAFMDDFYSRKLCDVINYSLEHSYNIENLAWCLYFLILSFQKCIPLMLNESLINALNNFLTSSNPILICISLTSISRITLSESPMVIEFLDHIATNKIIDFINCMNNSITNSALNCLLNIVVFSDKYLENVYNTPIIDYILHLKDESDLSSKASGASLLSFLILSANEDIRKEFVTDDIIEYFIEILEFKDIQTTSNIICAFASLFQVQETLFEKIELELLEEINENDLTDDAQEAMSYIKSIYQTE